MELKSWSIADDLMKSVEWKKQKMFSDNTSKSSRAKKIRRGSNEEITSVTQSSNSSNGSGSNNNRDRHFGGGSVAKSYKIINFHRLRIVQH